MDSRTNADMLRMMVGLIKTTHQTSTAETANDKDDGMAALLAQAEYCFNNADEVLKDAGCVKAADLVEV